MTELEIKDKTVKMRAGELTLQRDKERWTDTDRETLRREYYLGTPANEIAIMLERSESAIYQQIEQQREPERLLDLDQGIRYIKNQHGGCGGEKCCSKSGKPPPDHGGSQSGKKDDARSAECLGYGNGKYRRPEKEFHHRQKNGIVERLIIKHTGKCSVCNGIGER